MKLTLALTSLLLGFSAFATRPPEIAEIILTCVKPDNKGDAAYQVDVLRAGGLYFISTSLSMVPEVMNVRRSSMDRFLGTQKEFTVAFTRKQGSNFSISFEKVAPGLSWELNLDLECQPGNQKRIQFCEGYEDFEDCPRNDDDVDEPTRPSDPDNPDDPAVDEN